MTEIKLPPLPLHFDDFMDEGTKKAVQDYATAAIKADRKARSEPVAWWKVFEGQVSVVPASTFNADDAISCGWKPLGFLESPLPPQIPEGYRLQPLSEFDAMMDTRTIPEGYRLVPVEPTPKMKTAGIGVEVYKESKPEIGALTWAEVGSIYKAMLEVAPEPKEPTWPQHYSPKY